MTLKLVIDKLDDVEETLRGLYQPKDGKFELAVEGLPDINPLKNALQTERAARGDHDKKVKSWEKLGKSPEEIEALIDANKKADLKKAEEAGEWDKLKTQLIASHQEEIKGWQSKIDAKDKDIGSMRTTLEQHLVDATATAAIAANKGVPELLLPHIKKYVKVNEKDGKYSVQVVDDKGDPRINGKGDPLTIAALVGEMKSSDVFGRAFEGSGQSGSGMRPNGGSGGSSSTVKSRADFKSEKERAAFIDEHGLEAYQALPAA